MTPRTTPVIAVAAMLTLAACSAAVQSEGPSDLVGSTASGTPTTDTAPTETVATTTLPPPPPTTEPPLDVYDPLCVVKVAPGESLSLIADRFDDDTVRVDTLRAENDLPDDLIKPDQLLDVCVDNGLDDRTGDAREPNAALVEEATRANVEIQQAKLNELFAGTGMAELKIDGVSGSVTRQRLCAARLALGLVPSTTDMAAGSEEEQVLMAATSLAIPVGAPVDKERWVLVDQTCQVMFVGAGAETLQFVFPTSTGEPGYETRLQDRAMVYRYDPAFENGGWHNSTDFPVPEDNPLNGNMYKPLYFDGGLAIHGANNVPTSPQSKGCARLRLADHDALIQWLGIADVTTPIGGSRFGLAVSVQGQFVPPA
ncbi:MAG TPA: L,D-transpeptidase family protein [Ilumatobacteraceae bacterium]|nr:L,D-transpeptidase family protein [Ilumatobacteraceae bacterium]